MANDNVDKLRDLKQDLEQVQRQYADILKHEPLVEKPLGQAVDAARSRWGIVGGDSRGN